MVEAKIGEILKISPAPRPPSERAEVEARIRAAAVRLGERVRVARAERGLTRKDLAALSCVSLRYLAQIETGEGNGSLAVMTRVGAALGVTLGELVREPPTIADDGGAEVLARYNAAPATTRQAIRRLLNMPGEAEGRHGRIALIGLRGAGKSTLGPKLAAALGVRFVELNAEIEAESGMSISDLIALYGQDGYRRLEASAVGRLAALEEPMVLAVAGGIVSEEDTFAALLRGFHTVWLKASPEEHMERVRAQGDHRPMAGDPAAMDALKAILTSREAEYRRAAFLLDTSGESEDRSLEALLALVKANGVGES